MTGKFKVGTIAVTYDGVHSTFSQALTGFGFQPKAMKFWVASSSAGTFNTQPSGIPNMANGFQYSHGFTDGTTSFACTRGVADNDSQPGVGQKHSNSLCVLVSNVTGVDKLTASLTSFDADGCTLAFTISSLTTGTYYVHYIAIGGTGVSAKVGKIFTPASTGNFAVTGVGFQPKALIFVGQHNDVGNANNSHTTGMGFTDGVRQGLSLVGDTYAITGAPQQTYRYQRTNKCLGAFGYTDKAILYEASIVSMDADGFTLNFSTAAFHQAYYLALNIDAYVGTVTQPTTTGDQVVTGPSFSVGAILMQGVSKTAQTTAQDEHRYSLGATDGTSQVVHASGTLDVGRFNGVNLYFSETAVYRSDALLAASLTPADTGSASTIDASATLVDRDNSGDFTLNWGTADAVARQWVYLALAGADVAVPQVETRPATGIRHDRATLRGRINPDGTPMEGRFAWGTDPDDLSNETTPVDVGDGTSFFNYSTGITGLDPETTYYFRAIGNDGVDDIFGDILSFRTLGEQLFVDGEVSHPLTMLSLLDREEARHVFAEVDLNDAETYEGGYKAPWVLQWLPITRGFSDRTGAIEHMAFGAVLSDAATRFFRTLLDDPTNRFLTNRPLWEKMIDDEDRRLLGLWRFVANGYVSDYEPRSPLQFVITGCDWLKKKFSRKARAQRAWQPTITIEDFPNCPPENLGLAAPLPYGGVSDASVQTTEVGTTAPYDSSYPFISNGGAHDVGPGGGLNGRVWAQVVGIKAGVQGPITPFPSAGTIDYNRAILVIWDRPAADPTFFDSYEIYIYGGQGADVDWGDFSPQTGVRPGSNITFVRKLTHTNVVDPTLDAWASAPWAPEREMAVLLNNPTEGSDAMTGVTTASVDQGHGDLKPIYVGIETVDGAPHHKGLVARGAIKGIVELYVDGFAQHIATDATQAGVGGIWKIPGYPGWADVFADPYEDINDRRYTPIYGKVGFPGPDRMAGVAAPSTTGTDTSPLAVGVTLNVQGFEDIGDTTGELITSLAQQYKHFMRNFMAPDTPPGTEWLASCQTFAHIPDLTLVDEDSFDAVDDITLDIVEDGFEGAFVIGANGEFVMALDVLAKFNVSGDWNGTFTRKGQYTLSIEPKVAPIDPIAIDDIVNITADSFSIRDQVATEFFNILPYLHTKDYTGVTKSGWFSTEAGEVDVRDPTSITNYDQEREAPTFELAMLRSRTARGVATIAAVMARKLARYRHPLRTAACTVPLSGTQIEVGDVFQLSHLEGIGASGWEGRRVRTTRHELDPNANRTMLEVYDVEPLLELPT